MPFRRPLPRGFTLLELLVTVAILAILVALVSSAIPKMIDRARTVECLANMRSFGTALRLYAADNDGFPNLIGRANEAPRWKPDNGGLITALYPTYIQKSATRRLRCPSANAGERNGSGLTYQYAANVSLCYYYPKLMGLPVPASRVMLASECGAESYTFGANALNKAMWNSNSGPPDDPKERASMVRSGTLRLQYHGEGLNRGLHSFFLDGHAELVSPHDGDWKKSPTYGAIDGGQDNGGYFYDFIQFSRMASGLMN